MPFIAIKGTFHVVGYSPDGDSIRFKADDINLWDRISNDSGIKVRLNKKEFVQLRFEAIDTLETHYKDNHQPYVLAEEAMKFLLDGIGIGNVVWNDKHSRITSAANDGAKGYILCRQCDKYGRPIAFVYDSKSNLKTGAEVRLTKGLAKKSINFKSLANGLCYPTFYDGLFYDIREVMADCTKKGRKKDIGIWGKDKSNVFFKVSSDALENTLIIQPKLFRRLISYINAQNADTLFNAVEFKKSLSENPEKIFLLNKMHFTHLDNIITVNKRGKLKLTEKPEDVIFLG